MKKIMSLYGQYPLIISGACIVLILLVIIAVIFEARRRHVQRKKYERVCLHCHKPLFRQHVAIRLSSDSSGNFLTRLFSCMDYLCQTQARCLNPECEYEGEFCAEKTFINYWGPLSRICRFRQLRHAGTPDELVMDTVARAILKDRGQLEARPKKSISPSPLGKTDINVVPGLLPGAGPGLK